MKSRCLSSNCSTTYEPRRQQESHHQKLQAPVFKARKLKVPSSSMLLIDATPDTTRKPWDICPCADCVLDTKCTYTQTDNYREVCWLCSTTCDCPSLEDSRTQARIQQNIQKMTRESSTGSRGRAAGPASFRVNGGDEQASQISDDVGAIYNHETRAIQAA